MKAVTKEPTGPAQSPTAAFCRSGSVGSAVGSPPPAITSTYVVEVTTVLLPLGRVEVTTSSTALLVTSASVVVLSSFVVVGSGFSLVEEGSSSSSDVTEVTASKSATASSKR